MIPIVICAQAMHAPAGEKIKYTSTHVFTNDFAALTPDSENFQVDDSSLLVAESETGTCRVICYSPRHDLTLSRLSAPSIRTVVDLWAEQYRELGARNDIRYVQIFENRGEIMGCSNPHPHGQIWANANIPNEPEKEQSAQHRYRQQHASCLLCDYTVLEQRTSERIVCENEGFLALVPFWAIWPYEVLVLARDHVRDLSQLAEPSRNCLADILKKITTRYDNLFETAFPYSMGFHQAPTDGAEHPEWHLHAHFYPPLLRSATVKKFMVGYEMLATPQRDLTPEVAASQLRSSGEVHYVDRT
jgi:UDPglucose--hexose-1-phosphate uridylyltransferase